MCFNSFLHHSYIHFLLVVVAPASVYSGEADLNSKRKSHSFDSIVNRDRRERLAIQWFMAQKQSSWGAIAFSNEHFNLAGGAAINFAFAARRLIKYTQAGNWAP